MADSHWVLDAAWDECPPGVGMLSTVRAGGVSRAPWQSFNLGLHVGDEPEAVSINRQRLQALLPNAVAPQWLNQVHGTEVVHFTAPDASWSEPADAAFTRVPGLPLVILTADCLPVVMASADGTEVGVAHAGWRSLCGGVLERLVEHFHTPAHALRVWLGPAIGARAFEVGPEVRAAFCDQYPQAQEAFTPGAGDRWQANLVQLAQQRLHPLGVRHISGGHWCTWSDPGQFFSYRRDGQTGRMATLIWRHPTQPDVE